MNAYIETSAANAVDLDWSERERRQYERHAVNLYLRVVSVQGAAVLGEVVDISLGGFKLIGQQRMMAGRRMKLRLEFGLASGRRSGVAFEAKCIWEGPDEVSGLFAAGFAFCELSGAATEEIASVIAELSA